MIGRAQYKETLLAALHHFCDAGDLEHVRVLVEHNPDLINGRREFQGVRKPSASDQYTPLHYAVRARHKDVVEFLLKNKADVGADGGNGWTSLHFAAERGDATIVRILINAGADVTARTKAVPAANVLVFPSAPLPDLGDGTEKPPKFERPEGIPPLHALDIARMKKHSDAAAVLESAVKEKKERR